jgi:hypothetical protein
LGFGLVAALDRTVVEGLTFGPISIMKNDLAVFERER